MSAPTNTEEPSLAVEHRIRTRLLAHPRTVHYRLPKSRGGTTAGDNSVQIHHGADTDWHILFDNMVGKEVAAQLTVWWKRGLIFKGFDLGRFDCRGVAENTRWRNKHWQKLQKISFDQSTMQELAWKRLFCPDGSEAPPAAVLNVINSVFVHRDSPLELIQSKREGSKWNPLRLLKRRT